MKKVLLIWNGMAAKQVSGGDIYVKKLVEYSGKDFDIILSKSARDILKAKNVSQFYVTDNKLASSNLKLIRLYIERIKKSYKVIKRLKPKYDTVIASSPFIPDLLPAIKAKTNNKIVIFFHIIPKRSGKTVSTKLRFMMARIEQKISFLLIGKFFNTIMAGNEEVKSVLQKKFPNKKIVIAHAGIDTQYIDKIENKEKDPNLAVFVGRLTTQKGILDLVEVAKQVEVKNPKFKLVIVGSGPDKDLFVKTIEKEGVKSITFAGFVDEQKKYSLMKEASFFLFPSYEEGWGIALAEALYCKCLCFCYELPYYQSIFSNYPVYVDVGNSGGLAHSLIMKYKDNAKPDQEKFMKLYDDRKVIEDVIGRLG